MEITGRNVRDILNKNGISANMICIDFDDSMLLTIRILDLARNEIDKLNDACSVVSELLGVPCMLKAQLRVELYNPKNKLNEENMKIIRDNRQNQIYSNISLDFLGIKGEVLFNLAKHLESIQYGITRKGDYKDGKFIPTETVEEHKARLYSPERYGMYKIKEEVSK